MWGSFVVIVIGGVLSFLQFIVIHFIMIVVTFRIIKIITVKCNSLQIHVNIILTILLLLLIITITIITITFITFITLLILLLLLFVFIITFITFITKVVTPVILGLGILILHYVDSWTAIGE